MAKGPDHHTDAHAGEDPAAWDAWRALAQKALKGAAFDTLTTRTADGLVIEPLYAPAAPVFAGRAHPQPWQVVQRVDRDADAAAQALVDLENGAGALSLVFAGAPAAAGRGLTAGTVDALGRALDGVMLDMVPLHLEPGGDATGDLALLLALCEERGTMPAELHAGLDPHGAFAALGTMDEPAAEGARLAEAFREVDRHSVPGTLLRADGRMVFEAGGTAAQELAFALASLAATVRLLDAEGLGPDVTLARTAMALAADVDQMATIAKLRAARLLFAHFAQACGVDAPLTLHATTATRMLSFSDPHTNLLRLTVAAFAAGVGGADAVSVVPFDARGSAFARRVSRNIQSLLLEESHLAHFADPAAGSGAFEAMTDQLAQDAWAQFQAHEAQGLAARIADGTLARAVEEAALARRAAIEDGERVLIGVTRHPPQAPSSERPQPVEAPQGVRADPSVPFAERIARLRRGEDRSAQRGERATGAPTAPPLTARRDAAFFEDER